MPLDFILTTAGKAAIVAANNTGTAPVTITQIAIGSASWTPTAAATALNSQIKRISAIGGGAVSDDTIHVTGSDSTADVYTVKEVGLYLSSGVLLAIYSQSAPIITKGSATVALLAADLVLTGLPAGSITVGDTTFDYPPATTTVRGVVELATDAEAAAGTDEERALRPSNLGAIKLAIFGVIYPIGEILITRRSGNPSAWLGFGSWERYGQGRTIVGLNAGDASFSALDQIGGEASQTLSLDQMPNHTHTVDPPLTGTSHVGDHAHTIDPPATGTSSEGEHAHTAFANAANDGGSGGITGGPRTATDGSSTTSSNGIHTHTVDIAPFASVAAGGHAHTIDIAPFNSAANGGGQAHNNLQPYIVVMMWKRTA